MGDPVTYFAELPVIAIPGLSEVAVDFEPNMGNTQPAASSKAHKLPKQKTDFFEEMQWVFILSLQETLTQAGFVIPQCAQKEASMCDAEVTSGFYEYYSENLTRILLPCCQRSLGFLCIPQRKQVTILGGNIQPAGCKCPPNLDDSQGF